MMTMISLEDALRVLEEFAKDYFDQYDGTGKHAVNNPNRADPYTNGKGAGMDEAAEALRSLPAVDGVVVPREPTEGMWLAFMSCNSESLGYRERFRWEGDYGNFVASYWRYGRGL